VAVQRSGNGLGHTNEVTLRWVQLVLRGVTIFGWTNYLCM